MNDAFHRALIDSLPSQLCVLDESGRIVDVNRSWINHGRRNGIGSDYQWVGVNYLAVCESATSKGDLSAQTAARRLRKLLEGEAESIRVTYPCHSRHSRRWFQMRASRVEFGSTLYFLVVHEDVTPLRLAQESLTIQSERLRRDAFHDHLTGLANRSQFMNRLARCVEHAQKSDRCFAVLYIDLDRFKRVNDLYGHSAGDRLLTQVADRLQRAVRPEDLVARLGGDEFAVLLDGIVSFDIATRVCERVQKAVRFQWCHERGEIQVSASVGMKFADQHTRLASDLLSQADAAMYLVKKTSGRRESSDGDVMQCWQTTTGRMEYPRQESNL